MGRPGVTRVDAGFDVVVALRQVERQWDAFRDPAFWQEINPHLTVSDRPLQAVRGAAPEISTEAAARAAAQLDREGYLCTPPVVSESRMAPMRQAMDALTARGIPAGFACVYDEYFQLFHGLDPLFAPILGDGYRWVAHGFWAFRVPPGDKAVNTLWAPVEPHRDSMGPDPRVLAGQRPGIMTLWIALTDVTPSDSCLYVVPSHADRAFATAERDVRREHFELQDIRAVPARAGAVVSWSTHLIHWGSRSSADASGPRMSATMYLQRADMAPFDSSVFDPTDAIPLDNRLRWIVASLGAPGLVERLRW